jgi:hypothetical protein
LKIQGTAEAQPLQAEVSRIYRQRIVPLIDKYCTELSQPDHIHRIELLQISQQEQTAAHHGPSLKAMSQLELFAFFARTGSLPWWADTSQPRLLDACLQHLIQAAPEPLRLLMRNLVFESSAPCGASSTITPMSFWHISPVCWPHHFSLPRSLISKN